MLENLQRKVGPLPLWVWGVALGGVALIGYYRYSQEQKSANAPSTVVDGADLIDSLAGPGSAVQSAPSESVSYETNVSWRAKAVKILGDNGVAPLTAQIALDKYLQGQSLTGDQAQLVNTAIGALGVPPDGTLEIPTVSDTTTSASVVKTQYYKGTDGWYYLVGKGISQRTRTKSIYKSWNKIYPYGGSKTPAQIAQLKAEANA